MFVGTPWSGKPFSDWFSVSLKSLSRDLVFQDTPMMREREDKDLRTPFSKSTLQTHLEWVDTGHKCCPAISFLVDDKSNFPLIVFSEFNTSID